MGGVDERAGGRAGGGKAEIGGGEVGQERLEPVRKVWHHASLCPSVPKIYGHRDVQRIQGRQGEATAVLKQARGGPGSMRDAARRVC